MNYMTAHLLEAIKLNCQRLPKYARLTRGKSIKVSLLLVWSEAASLSTAFTLDLMAKYWQKRGVPVFVHEFIPMENTPEFKTSYPFEIKELESLPKMNMPKKRIKGLIAAGAYSELGEELNSLIHKLESWPHVFCMTRHTLESFLRCANLTSMHIQRASELGVKSPEKFCKLNLRSHAFALGFCLFLDKLAFSVQNGGVPIICQDVPPIPAVPEKY